MTTMRVLVIHFNQWGDTMLYQVQDPSEQQLQLLRDAQWTQREAEEQSDATRALDHLLEVDYKRCWMVFGPWTPIENVDLVLFCGVTQMELITTPGGP